uniref:Uncharacterized protein n=1 Tax=Daucus carota subsp. sativus TaxID=79200 RepID=A0A166H0U4_DAUCS
MKQQQQDTAVPEERCSFDLNIAAYEKYSKLYLSPLFALSIGSGFLRFTATLTHVALFNGSTSNSLNHNQLGEFVVSVVQGYMESKQNEGINLKWWGTELDHCPLATCPTAPGISVPGCPVF